MNFVALVGNVVRDAAARVTGNGTKVANFTVATHRRWNDRDGNRQEDKEFSNIVAWGRLGEVAEQYLKAGKLVSITGRLKTTSWDDTSIEVDNGSGGKQPLRRWRTEVVATSIEMLGPNGNAQQPAEEAAAPPVVQNLPSPTDDDIPF